MRFFGRLFGRRTEATDASGKAVDATNILDATFRFVAVDFETANANPSSICQIGLGLVNDRGNVHTIGTLVNPETDFDPNFVQVHGIGPKDTADAPTFPDVLDTFRDFMERHTLVQHSNFDKTAMKAACDRYGIPALDARWIDSVVVARRAWPQLTGNGGHGLANLSDFLGIEFRHHDAAEDAKAAALVVLHAEARTGRGFEDLGAPNGSRGRTYPKKVTAAGNADGAMFGEVACFTGQLKVPRAEAAKIAAAAGITVKANVTKSTTILIVGDQDMSLLAGHRKSSKHRRAEELVSNGHTIRIIGETEFFALLRSE